MTANILDTIGYKIRNSRKTIILIIIGLLVLPLLYSVLYQSFYPRKLYVKNDTVEPLYLNNLDGSLVRLASFGNKVKFIRFDLPVSAPTGFCPYSDLDKKNEAELPGLFSNEDVVFITFIIGIRGQEVQNKLAGWVYLRDDDEKFLKKFFEYRNYIMVEYLPEGYPAYVVLDKNNKIIFTSHNNPKTKEIGFYQNIVNEALLSN